MALPNDDRRAIKARWRELVDDRHSHFHKEVVVPNILIIKKEIVTNVKTQLELLDRLCTENNIRILRTMDHYGALSHEYVNANSADLLEAWSFLWENIRVTYADINNPCPAIVITPEHLTQNALDTLKDVYLLSEKLQKHTNECGAVVNKAIQSYGSTKYMLAAIPEMRPVVPERCLPHPDWKPKSTYKVPSRDIFTECGLSDPVVLTTYFGNMSMEGCL